MNDLPDLRFDRICRTSHSEAFLISSQDTPFGRVDLHYGWELVHALLVVEQDLSEEDTAAVVRAVDEHVVATADQPRADFIVTVYRGNEVGVFTDEDEGDEEVGEEVDGGDDFDDE